MDKRIRLLFTTSNFHTAGSGKVIYDLINGLDRSKFAIEIACSHNEGFFFKTIESLDLPIHIFDTKTNYRPHYSLLPRIYYISKFFKRHKYDLVHSWQWSNDWTEAIAAKLAGAKWIYTKKAMGFDNRHWHIKSYVADFIITINDEMRAYFPHKKKQRLIPLGIDTSYYSAQHFPKKKNSSAFQIITVANLVPVKGIEVLLEAMKSMEDASVRLTIVGDDAHPYGSALKQKVKYLNLYKQVLFLGKQSDVRPHIAAADVYVIPTLDQGRKEGMPMALVEAMSMGIPVLGSDISGIKYVLKDFKHLLFKAGDAHTLSLMLSTMRDQALEDRKALGMALRTYCMAHFTVEAFVEAHDILYDELLNPKKFHG